MCCRTMRRRNRRHSWPSSTPTAAQVAKRVKRFQRAIDVLTAKDADPGFRASEQWKRDEQSRLIKCFTTQTRELHESAAERIDVIFTQHSKLFQASRGFISQWFESIPDFRFCLSSFSFQTGSTDKNNKNYGPYVATPEVLSEVHAIVAKYKERVSRIRTKYEGERERLLPFKFGGYTTQDLDKVRIRLAAATLELERRDLDEQKLRSVYGVDDNTIAQAAAHSGHTRQHGAKIKTRLFPQTECPYCGGELGDAPHADHIYPVILGGLSTLENMVLACSVCNLQKAHLTIREFAERFGKNRELIEGRLTRLGKRT